MTEGDSFKIRYLEVNSNNNNMSSSMSLEDKSYSFLFLHNLAATPQKENSAKCYFRVIKNYLDESDDHEINERDPKGRTALHMAVQYHNIDALVGLLMCGADVNVDDLECKSPFTYIFDNFDPSTCENNLLFFTLHGHVHKLLALGFDVSEENRKCYGLARTWYAFDDSELQIGYEFELDEMQDIQIIEGSTLRDFLYNGVQALATSILDRKILEEILTASDFLNKFPKLGCLVMLQYRKGLTRKKMMERNSCSFLHNLAATPQPESSVKGYIRVIENYLDESDDHEINERDSEGRTALHIAVQKHNIDAVVGLLMCGADVNVGDFKGKSPFTYILDTFKPSAYKSNLLFFTLHSHVHKLLALSLEVSEENRKCYGRARTWHAFNDKQFQIGYALELDKMQDVQVARGTTLCDVLYSGAQALATSTLKRRTLEEILTASDFFHEFPKLCCLIALQYRKGLTRKKLMEPAKSALEVILGFSLPDPCSENIILHLGEEDLINLIKINTVDS